MTPKQRHADACHCTVEQLPGSMRGQKGIAKGDEHVGMNTPVCQQLRQSSPCMQLLLARLALHDDIQGFGAKT